MEIFGLESRDEALQLGMKLQRKHFIENVSKGNHSFGDNRYFFRLYSLSTPSILNSLRVWKHQSNDVSGNLCTFAKISTNTNAETKLISGTNQCGFLPLEALGKSRIASY